MKTITNLTTLIYDLNDKAIRQDDVPLTILKALATCIARYQSEDPVRMMDLAHRLMHAQDNRFPLEDNDFKALKKAVLADRLYTDIVKAPILVAFAAAETPLAPEQPDADQPDEPNGDGNVVSPPPP